MSDKRPKGKRADAIILGGDGGFLVRGVMTDDGFLKVADEWLCPDGKSLTPCSDIHHGWWRWVHDFDEGGSLLYGAEPHARGAFQAAVMDSWELVEVGKP